MQCMAEKNYFNWQSAAGNFDKKPQAKKKEKFQKGTLGKLTASTYPHAFECYKRRFCKQHLLATYDIMPSIQI